MKGSFDPLVENHWTTRRKSEKPTLAVTVFQLGLLSVDTVVIVEEHSVDHCPAVGATDDLDASVAVHLPLVLKIDSDMLNSFWA